MDQLSSKTRSKAKPQPATQMEKKLFQMAAADSVNFTDIVLSTITSDKPNLDGVFKSKKILSKQDACSLLLDVLITTLREEKWTIKQTTFLLESTIKTLYSLSVQSDMFPILQRILQVIFETSKDLTLSNKILSEAKERLLTSSLDDYAVSLCIINVIAGNPFITEESLKEWFLELSKILVDSANNYIEDVNNDLADRQKSVANQQQTENRVKRLEALEIWTKTVDLLICNGKSFKSEIMIEEKSKDIPTDIQEIATILLKILLLQNSGSQQDHQHLPNLDDNLNSLKIAILQSFGHLIEQREKGNPSLLEEIIKNDGIKIVLQSLFEVSSSQPHYSISQKIQDENFNRLMREHMVIVAKFTSFPECHSAFSDPEQQKIIMNVCLPLIAFTESELKTFFFQPGYFFNVIQDLEKNPNARHIRPQAILLLKHLCLNIEGALSNLVMLMSTISDYTLISNNLEEIDIKFQLLGAHRDSFFINSVPPTTRFETCLLVFSVLSDLVLTREELTQISEKLLKSYAEFLLGSGLEWRLKCRVCHFLGKYLFYFFKKGKNDELLERSLEYLVECALSNDSDQIISEQATQSLHELLATNHETQHLPSPMVLKILAKFKTLNKKAAQSTTVLDIIHEVLYQYKSAILENPNLLTETISKLDKIGKGELKTTKAKNDDFSNTLDKIWSILNVISSEKEYSEFRPEVEKITSTLLTDKKTQKIKYPS